MDEQQLASWTFTNRDAIFIADSTQLEALKRSGNVSLNEPRYLSLSMDAYAALLQWERTRLVSHAPYVDFSLVEKWYHDKQNSSRRWLNELNLGFIVGGINVVEFDAANQFFLFLHVASLADTAARMLRAHPDLDNIYVLQSDPLVPAEFYFESDITSCIVQFVGGSEGRSIDAIRYTKTEWRFPDQRVRPLLRAKGRIGSEPHAMLSSVDLGRGRIGFAPSTVAAGQYILDEVRALPSQTVLFSSSWGWPLLGSHAHDVHIDFPSFASPPTQEVIQELSNLLRNWQHLRQQSRLPVALVQNPFLDFQWQHIFKRRWLHYAQLIQAADRVVAAVPLEILIRSELRHDEIALLAEVYRKAGTRIVIAPHSGWPCDRNWASWKQSDVAFVSTHAAAKRLGQVGPVGAVYVTGFPPVSVRQSLIRPRNEDALLAAKRQLAQGRRIIMLMTNVPELNAVPFVELQEHLSTVRAALSVPADLSSEVLVAARQKPGILGEDRRMYDPEGSLANDRVSFLDGLTLAESLQLVSCVVGVNLPTSGFYDVLRAGVPLLHIQTAAVVTKHPNLPSSVIPVIRQRSLLWPALRRLLRDEKFRQNLAAKQQRYFRKQTTSRVSGSLRSVLHRVPRRRDRWWWPQARFQPQGNIEAPTALPPSRSILLAEIKTQLVAGRALGYIDDVTQSEDSRIFVEGWAADNSLRRPAIRVHFFTGERSVGTAEVRQWSPHVAEFHDEAGYEVSGFLSEIALPDDADTLSAFAEFADGSFGVLTRAFSLRPALQGDASRLEIEEAGARLE